LTLTDGGEPERVPAQVVTANLFPLLGVSPQRGHGFDAADDVAGAPILALISDAMWHRRIRRTRPVIGRTIRLDNLPVTVIGVMPPGFKFPSRSELWIAMQQPPGSAAGSVRNFSFLGRLKPDTSLDRANADLASHVLPVSGSRTIRVGFARLLSANAVGSEERTITGALMGATTCSCSLPARTSRICCSRGSRAAARDCRARGPRREPGPHRPPVAHGVCAVGIDRQRAGVAARLVWHRVGPQRRARVRAPRAVLRGLGA
jgi:hypothetical protein